MIVDYLVWGLYGSVIALVAMMVFVLRKWDSLDLPMKLLPVDVLVVVLLLDLSIKSNGNVTVDNLIMKIEAIAFTGLLTLVLFAPVFWRAARNRNQPTAR